MFEIIGIITVAITIIIGLAMISIYLLASFESTAIKLMHLGYKNIIYAESNTTFESFIRRLRQMREIYKDKKNA